MNKYKIQQLVFVSTFSNGIFIHYLYIILNPPTDKKKNQRYMTFVKGLTVEISLSRVSIATVPQNVRPI